MVESGLKQDVAKVVGSVFGKETEDTFLQYYDDNNPKELLKACKEMMTKMLGPAATKRHFYGMVKKHPEIRKVVEELK
jgi:hypothetical protein